MERPRRRPRRAHRRARHLRTGPGRRPRSRRAVRPPMRWRIQPPNPITPEAAGRDGGRHELPPPRRGAAGPSRETTAPRWSRRSREAPPPAAGRKRSMRVSVSSIVDILLIDSEQRIDLGNTLRHRNQPIGLVEPLDVDLTTVLKGSGLRGRDAGRHARPPPRDSAPLPVRQAQSQRRVMSSSQAVRSWSSPGARVSAATVATQSAPTSRRRRPAPASRTA